MRGRQTLGAQVVEPEIWNTIRHSASGEGAGVRTRREEESQIHGAIDIRDHSDFSIGISDDACGAQG